MKALAFSLILIAATAAMAHEGMEETKDAVGAKATTTTVTGEVIDMACYLDHGATGEPHAACASTCIDSGLPVGLKTPEGTVYLVIGQHKLMDKQLAPYAAKTITLKGKVVTRDGVNLLENAEIIK